MSLASCSQSETNSASTTPNSSNTAQIPSDFRLEADLNFEDVKALAEQGDASAQHKLGLMYYHGKGVNVSYIQAAKWFRRAAEQGVPNAQFWLGAMYELGRGVQPDDVTAYQWMILGTAQGYEGGEMNKTNLAKRLTLSQIAEAENRAAQCLERNYKGCR